MDAPFFQEQPLKYKRESLQSENANDDPNLSKHSLFREK